MKNVKGKSDTSIAKDIRKRFAKTRRQLRAEERKLQELRERQLEADRIDGRKRH